MSEISEEVIESTVEAPAVEAPAVETPVDTARLEAVKALVEAESAAKGNRLLIQQALEKFYATLPLATDEQLETLEKEARNNWDYSLKWTSRNATIRLPKGHEEYLKSLRAEADAKNVSGVESRLKVASVCTTFAEKADGIKVRFGVTSKGARMRVEFSKNFDTFNDFKLPQL